MPGPQMLERGSRRLAGSPDSMLLMPLIEVAADVLRELEMADVPASLRPLHGFDRARPARRAGPRQLRRALIGDDVVSGAGGRAIPRPPEVGAMLAAWTAETAPTTAADAAAAAISRCTRRRSGPPDPRATPSGSVSRWCSTRSNASGGVRPTKARAADAGTRRARRGAPRAERRAHRGRRGRRERAEQELQKERTARRTPRRRSDRRGGRRAAPGRRAADATRSSARRGRGAAEPSDRASQRVPITRRRLAEACAPTPRELRARAESAESRLSDRDARARSPTRATARPAAVGLARRACNAACATARPPKPQGRREVRSGREPPAPTRRTAPQTPRRLIADSPAGVEAMLAHARCRA